MNPFIVFYNFIVSLISPLLVFVARRWGNRFYLFLAAVFSVLIAVDAEYLHVTEKMQHGAFDFMMSHRIIVPKPDPNIIIVDINEASLAAMAPEYGRWPWPRQPPIGWGLDVMNPAACCCGGLCGRSPRPQSPTPISVSSSANGRLSPTGARVSPPADRRLPATGAAP